MGGRLMVTYSRCTHRHRASVLGSEDKCFRQCRIGRSQFASNHRNPLRCSGDFLCRCVRGGLITEKLNRGFQLVAFLRNDCLPLVCEGELTFQAPFSAFSIAIFLR